MMRNLIASWRAGEVPAEKVADAILAKQGHSRKERRELLAATKAMPRDPVEWAGHDTKDTETMDNAQAQAFDQFKTSIEQFKSKHTGELDEAHARMDEMEKLIGRVPAGGGSATARVDPKDVAAFLSAVKDRDVSVSEAAGVDLAEYRAALDVYFRVGDHGITPDIKAAMTVGSNPDGGYWVEPQLANSIRSRLFDTSPMRQFATVIQISNGDSLKIPLDTNDATSGGWVGETASRPETATPEIGEQLIYLREQYAMPKVTQKLLDMAMFPVDTWLTNKIADKFGRDENTAFVTGTGVNQPRGFLDYNSAATTEDDDVRAWGKLQYVVTGASGAFPSSGPADPLVDVQHKLKAAYRDRAVWVMNRATAAEVRKLKDGDGRFLWSDQLTAGMPPTFAGSPVTFFENMPDIAADSFSIAYGDFSAAYTIIDGPGYRVLRDPYTSKGWTKFYATKWTGGDVTDFDAIKLLKFGTS